MADEKGKAERGRILGFFGRLLYKGIREPVSSIGSKIPIARRLKMKNIPLISPEERLRVVERELKAEFEKNDEMVSELNKIETARWPEVVKEKEKIEKEALNLGPYLYTTELLIERERQIFMNNQVNTEAVKGGKRLTPVMLGFEKGDEEEAVVIGHQNYAVLIESLSTSYNAVKANEGLTETIGQDGKMNITLIYDSLKTAIDQSREYESEFENRLKNLIGSMKTIFNSRDNLIGGLDIRPQYLHYKHTYNIIQPFYFDEEKREVIYFEDEFKGFKLSGEIAPGLDERGMPLEVYEEGNKWYVLLDKWAYEIKKNRWQMKRIEEKIVEKEKENSKAGKAMEEEFNKFIKRAENGPKGRKVDERFVGPLNMLDTVNYLNNEWDAVRDDYRDGRYHPWSRTVHDYILAQEKGINTAADIQQGDLETINGKGWNVDPAKREPVNFRKLPGGESSVTRDCKVWEHKGKDWSTWASKKGERKPKHLSPAYDRAALGIGRNGNEKIWWRHWGRLYYYDTTDGINEWSENPDPAISTRGSAKFLINSVLENEYLWQLEDVRKVLARSRYDFGIRKFGGNFTNDPFGGASGILRYGDYLGR